MLPDYKALKTTMEYTELINCFHVDLENKNQKNSHSYLRNKLMENRNFDSTQIAITVLLFVTLYLSNLESQYDQMKIYQYALQFCSIRSIGSEHHVPLDMYL